MQLQETDTNTHTHYGKIITTNKHKLTVWERIYARFAGKCGKSRLWAIRHYTPDFNGNLFQTKRENGIIWRVPSLLAGGKHTHTRIHSPESSDVFTIKGR